MTLEGAGWWWTWTFLVSAFSISRIKDVRSLIILNGAYGKLENIVIIIIIYMAKAYNSKADVIENSSSSRRVKYWYVFPDN